MTIFDLSVSFTPFFKFMRIAIIDLGTNTFHLLIAEVNGQEATILFKTNEPVRLGEDITKANQIIPTAFNRGISCLERFKEKIDELEVTTVKAFATSGVRSANNGQDFVDTVAKNTGIKINVIDGDEEANLIYMGVRWSGAIKEKSLIMDIGGGSTEFIICDQNQIIWKKSYNIGAARLMQKFFSSDPISHSDQKAIEDHLNNELQELNQLCALHQPKKLIGSAGAFETFALMTGIDDTRASTPIDMSTYHQLATQLIQATHNERANMKGLIPLRVDMIVMASLLVNYILNRTQIKELILSTYDLKMGALSQCLEQEN